MKSKLFMAAAAVMAVVCLAGCSAGISSKKFVNSVESRGMKEYTDSREFLRLIGGTGEDESYYYVGKDQKADTLCSTFLGTEADSGATEFIACIEWKMGEGDDYLCLNNIYYITAKNKSSAEKIYEKAKYNGLHDQISGTKNGIQYSINYIGAGDFPVHDSYSGAYLKGNTVIYIRGNCYSDCDNELVETVCKDLGLESPYTLR